MPRQVLGDSFVKVDPVILVVLSPVIPENRVRIRSINRPKIILEEVLLDYWKVGPRETADRDSEGVPGEAAVPDDRAPIFYLYSLMVVGEAASGDRGIRVLQVDSRMAAVLHPHTVKLDAAARNRDGAMRPMSAPDHSSVAYRHVPQHRAPAARQMYTLPVARSRRRGCPVTVRVPTIHVILEGGEDDGRLLRPLGQQNPGDIDTAV